MLAGLDDFGTGPPVPQTSSLWRVYSSVRFKRVVAGCGSGADVTVGNFARGCIDGCATWGPWLSAVAP